MFTINKKPPEDPLKKFAENQAQTQGLYMVDGAAVDFFGVIRDANNNITASGTLEWETFLGESSLCNIFLGVTFCNTAAKTYLCAKGGLAMKPAPDMSWDTIFQLGTDGNGLTTIATLPAMYVHNTPFPT